MTPLLAVVFTRRAARHVDEAGVVAQFGLHFVRRAGLRRSTNDVRDPALRGFLRLSKTSLAPITGRSAGS